MATFALRPAACCGVYEMKEISSLPDAATVIKQTTDALAREGWYPHKPPAHIFFTGVVGERLLKYSTFHHADTSRDYGTELAAFIVANKLGTIVESPVVPNGKSGNPLRMWVWTPDWTAVKGWRK